MVKSYIPKQGDIVFLDFDPTKGHEQKGYRPAIVISNDVFNKNTKMVILCPITSNGKEFPTHYLLQDSKRVKGSVLCEHIRSIDYEIRNLKYVEKASDDDFESVTELINACL
ncbi:MAG: type II toxin-antitoxin system PemK/MazF family toxin [Bacilli bacterium]|nr:type II toxin-antitoxin system PemK/MazF family toxin [Bacilli bacterium]